MLDADVEVDRREFTVRVALQVTPGERLALFGPSGAGKTTLLEAVAGLVQPRRGRIALGDRVLTSTAPPVRAVPPWQRRVGLLRQDPGLFPHLSVRDNLCYARSAPRSEGDIASGRLVLSGFWLRCFYTQPGFFPYHLLLGSLLFKIRVDHDAGFVMREGQD